MRLKVLRRTLIPTNLHPSKLIPLPFYKPALHQPQAPSHKSQQKGRGDTSKLTIQIRTPHKANVHAEIAVVGGAVEAQVDAEGHAGPRGVFGAAVEAAFVGLFALQLLEERVRDGLWREGHG